MDNDRWVFHITNWTGNKFERAHIDDNYLAPVENVRLHFLIPENKTVGNISTFVDLPFRKKVSGNKIEIIFPRIEAYQAVQVDFE